MIAALVVAVAVADADPCTLLTAAEISAAIGKPVPAMKPMGGSICTADASGIRVLVRVAKRTGPPDREAKGLEMIKKMGAQVDFKKFGAATCTSIAPPPAGAKSAALNTFNTTCSVLKDGTVAAVEITAKEQKDAVPIDRLGPLGEKLAARF